MKAGSTMEISRGAIAAAVRTGDSFRVAGMRLKAAVLMAALVAALLPWEAAGAQDSGDDSIVLAVEFNAHAACAHVARSKGWFEAQGIRLKAYDSYVTGMALAAGLMRGDVDAAYICLIPAINVYANGGVPLKVVAGTHRYGYAMVVNPRAVKTARDLEKPGVRIGCSSEGSPTDAILHRIIDTYKLDGRAVMDNVRRMNPPKQLLSLKMGQLDAAVVPEQYPSMAEELGFPVLARAQDLWPDMQGSVLVVTDDLIRRNPEVVSRLVKVTVSATDWINKHPREAAAIVASELNRTGDRIFPEKAAAMNSQFEVTPSVMHAALEKGLEYCTGVRPEGVDEAIAYGVKLGYLRKGFDSGEILDLRWLSQ